MAFGDLIQTKVVEGAWSATTTITFDNPVVLGNSIVLAFMIHGAITPATTNTVADLLGNTYFLDMSSTTVDDLNHYLYRASSSPVGSNTITITWTNDHTGDNVKAVAREYEGNFILDQTSQQNLGDVFNSGNITTTQPNELLVGVAHLNGGAAITVGSGWGNFATSPGSGRWAIEDRKEAATGTFAATFGFGGSGYNCMAKIASYYAGAAPEPPSGDILDSSYAGNMVIRY